MPFASGRSPFRALTGHNYIRLLEYEFGISAPIPAVHPPVFVFLFALRLLDSYRLVSMRQVLRAIGYGCLAAGLCFAVDAAIFAVTPSRARWHTVLGAPMVEEICKAAYVLVLIRRARVGFMVDAAICGFAVGAGFALIENLYYLRVLAGSSLAVWTCGDLVRPSCTAVLPPSLASCRSTRGTAARFAWPEGCWWPSRPIPPGTCPS